MIECRFVAPFKWERTGNWRKKFTQMIVVMYGIQIDYIASGVVWNFFVISKNPTNIFSKAIFNDLDIESYIVKITQLGYLPTYRYHKTVSLMNQYSVH